MFHIKMCGRGGCMIDIKCETPVTLKLGELVPFQGDLKKRTSGNIKQLAESILADGLLMPFAVWKNEEGKNCLLDGHGRLAALSELLVKDGTIAEQVFPVIFVEAETEEQARKSLLQITSSYGHITKVGAEKFCAKIPEYHAPAINKYIHRKVKTHKEQENMDSFTKLHIAVKTEYVTNVIDLLKKMDYIRVLK